VRSGRQVSSRATWVYLMMAAPHIIVSATRSGSGFPSRPRHAARPSRRRVMLDKNVSRGVLCEYETGTSILYVLVTLLVKVTAWGAS
jgi:hypothetical protein